jgi:hypothetical protein
MKLHEIEAKLIELKLAEEKAEAKLASVVNYRNYDVKMVGRYSKTDVYIESLFDETVWNVLINRARMEVDKARKAIQEFEAKFSDE